MVAMMIFLAFGSRQQREPLRVNSTVTVQLRVQTRLGATSGLTAAGDRTPVDWLNAGADYSTVAPLRGRAARVVL
jgi:hypothetical protein